jgi:predicted metal-dependent HD superfamily phosphohydrolase
MLLDRFKEAIYSKSPSLGHARLDIISQHLFKLYTIPHRDYHNLDHIAHCFTEVDCYQLLDTNIELALFYHDCIYVASERNNEKNSADWAEYDLKILGIHQDDIEEIKRLILVTKHDIYPNERIDDQIIVDIDMSILGQSPGVYTKYRIAVREEYGHVTDYWYATGRTKFLKGLLDRPRIYQTDFFRDRYEVTARDNISNELKVLAGMKYRDQ